ncbi:MFS transporter [Dellaglioa sp. BT-FLS60]
MLVSFFVPMALVTNIWQLGGLRFLIGLADAAMFPAVQTLIAKNTPSELTGRVFSYNQSFQSLGSVVGPMIGSTISGIFDYGGVFISTAILVTINLLWVIHVTKGMHSKIL